MEPVLSVIIPAYNSQLYLQECVESVIGQTFKALEIIIVDDGSTDSTYSIAEQLHLKYPDTVFCKHVQNGGVTSARLKGVQLARGEWIGFVDSDDRIDPDMYEHLLQNAIDYHADISHCGYRTIVNEERVHFFYNTGRLIRQDQRAGLKDLLEGFHQEYGRSFDELLSVSKCEALCI